MGRYGHSWKSHKHKPKQVRKAQIRLQGIRQAKFLIPILIGLILAWAALLLYHPYFQIQSIQVELIGVADAQVYQQWLGERIAQRKPLDVRRNYFLFNTEKHSHALNQKFALIQGAVDKTFPKTLTITVQEEQDEIFVYQNKTLYRVFTNGEIQTIDEKPTPYMTKLVYPKENRGEGEQIDVEIEPKRIFDPAATYGVIKRTFGDIPVVFVGDEKKISGELTKTILYFTTLIDRSSLPARVGGQRYYTMDDDDLFLLTLNTSNFSILFSTNNDVPRQLEQLTNVLTTENNLPSVDYIDVRFGSTVFIQRNIEE